MRKPIIMALLLMAVVAIASAQDLKVINFEPTTEIQTADKQRKDINGNVCALIRVQLPINGVEFQGNVIECVYDVNEYLVFVTPNTKMIRVKCPGYHTLDINFADYGVSETKSKRVYKLNLHAPSRQQGQDMSSAKINIKPKQKKQYMPIPKEYEKEHAIAKALLASKGVAAGSLNLLMHKYSDRILVFIDERNRCFAVLTTTTLADKIGHDGVLAWSTESSVFTTDARDSLNRFFKDYDKQLDSIQSEKITPFYSYGSNTKVAPML